MVSNSAKEGKGGVTFFAVITSILMLGISLLSLVNLVLFYKRSKTD